MTLLKVIKHPNKILREKSEEIHEINNETKTLVYNMIETMYKNEGIGLAANQIGILKRIIVVDLQEEDKELDPMVFINPRILWQSEEYGETEEGCLSIPKIREIVKRPAKIKISYLDLSSKKHIIEADGLLATCLQHEIDHLNGVLFVDRLSKLKKDMALKKYKKMQNENEK